MNSTTLRGVFPEPKPIHKRNFIKENVKHIKQMQGILQESGLFDAQSLQERYQNKPKKILSKRSVSQRSQHIVNKSVSQSHTSSKMQKATTKRSTEPLKLKLDADKGKGETLNIKPHLPPPIDVGYDKYLHRGVQTDTPEDIQKLYRNGTIKYPSPAVAKAIANKKSPKKKDCGTQGDVTCEQDRGDNSGIIVPNPHNDYLDDNMQRLNINEKHNFIKENIQALKQKTQRQDSMHDSLKILNYQKGVLPKYLKDRKEEQKKELEDANDCPEGHVLLPEEERKETLRVLRQSYADRIQELNSMPVRNDTLRMRKRKMVIEEELKKIDEGIKVFQRPKVFVKINA